MDKIEKDWGKLGVLFDIKRYFSEIMLYFFILR